MHAAPLSPGDVGDEPEARLVVLDPEHSHSSKTQESPARDFAARILDERAGGPRLHRNMLVFLAPDTARLEELRDAARSFLAWTSVHRDQESLNLDTVQRSQVEARTTEWDDSVNQRIGEAYQWLLVPAGSAGEAEVRWEVTRAGGSEPLAGRASRRLRAEEGLIPSYSGARLRMDLDRVPLWRDDRVSVRDLWSYYTQYLYLPRLRDVSVLLNAIADGTGLITWEEDGFAVADAWDEAKGRYVGLKAGEPVALSDPVGLLVKPERALAQLADEREAASSGPVGPRPGPDGAEPISPPVEPEDRKPKRFYGRVQLDPLRVTRDVGQIADAIVQHLSGLLGAEVEVTLELSAEIPEAHRRMWCGR